MVGPSLKHERRGHLARFDRRSESRKLDIPTSASPIAEDFQAFFFFNGKRLALFG